MCILAYSFYANVFMFNLHLQQTPSRTFLRDLLKSKFCQTVQTKFNPVALAGEVSKVQLPKSL
jgi:hypothetical protein